MKNKIFILLIGCFAASAFAFGRILLDPMSPKDIEERTLPLGNVEVVEASDEDIDDSISIGERVYKKHCSVCHEAGVAGAPKKGSPDWQPRLAKGKDVLLQSVINGLGAMPPKGTCVNCSNNDLAQAIDYMTE